MWHLLFGDKTVGFFDLWSFQHLLSGISLGTLVIMHNKNRFFGLFSHFGKDTGAQYLKHRSFITRYDLFALLGIAYGWEAIEHYLETGLLGSRIAFWFQGVEAWDNRLIADPLMLIIGYMIARQHPRLVWPARIGAACWLAMHVFVFPHSMYLQNMLFGKLL